MTEKNDDEMTTAETAKYLDKSLPWLYEHVRKGNIPGRKEGNHWKFSKREIDQWSKDNSLRFVIELHQQSSQQQRVKTIRRHKHVKEICLGQL
jgi:excisionase family DNA binding protein